MSGHTGTSTPEVMGTLHGLEQHTWWSDYDHITSLDGYDVIKSIHNPNIVYIFQSYDTLICRVYVDTYPHSDTLWLDKESPLRKDPDLLHHIITCAVACINLTS